jgi:alginate O-acetyltransferase complex protein AlgI
MPPLDPARILSAFVFDPKDPLGFVSGTFLVLALVLLAVYPFGARSRRGRVLTLLLFSLYFYYKTGGGFIALLVLSTSIDYGIGRALGAARKHGHGWIWLWGGIALNVAVLVAFKYGRWIPGGWDSLAVPVGISYYIFQKISYLADVYRQKAEPVRRADDFLLYVAFFPRVVAGPIVRAGEFMPQLDRPYAPDRFDVGEAVFLILTGLFKKAVIADFIGLNFVDRVFATPALYSGLENLLAVYGYAIQIYCDFSGYTDIALGIGRLLGFRLPPNFKSPYKAATISEFWSGWHMTLSRWLMDYLFWPIALRLSAVIKSERWAGIRTDKIIPVAASMATFLICGLWHGAAWGFIVWGALHGAAISLERVLRLPQKVKKTPLRRAVGRFLAFHYICLGWIFFRSGRLSTAGAVIGQIFAHFKAALLPQFIRGYPLVFGLIILGFSIHWMPKGLKYSAKRLTVEASWPVQAFLLAAMIWLVFQFRAADIQPFIYFKF